MFFGSRRPCGFLPFPGRETKSVWLHRRPKIVPLSAYHLICDTDRYMVFLIFYKGKQKRSFGAEDHGLFQPWRSHPKGNKGENWSNSWEQNKKYNSALGQNAMGYLV